ncbi:thioredoxin [Litorivita pollutaquae]|uniref:Thioredoxin n=1 Tax=Litorivita pollutaquae TaxID=2200892 RepID=A0A2V4MZ18_9RHOB|nr:TlpA disulfide reductase family protein [Litorivita pollutaquae]PYC47814.1 thioredoxin [Litorivita pollutaquae]
MKFNRSAVVYTALALGAIAAIGFVALQDPASNSAPADYSALEALRAGEMKKLAFAPAPKAVSTQAFTRKDGSTGTLAEYQGKVTVLNFWATWCAPCRKEMPSLAALQSQMGDQINVVTLATGRNPPPAIDAFLTEVGAVNLPRHRDPKSAIARDMAVLGLPITVILDANGMEIARLTGDADWASGSAKAILAALADPEQYP